MVYKKYIKRGGKIYGPYIYESKRVNGKVVSEYHGHKKSFNIKKFALIFGAIFLIAAGIYLISYVDLSKLTGLVVLDTKTEFAQNLPVKGNVTITLDKGELLPADSKLVLENSGQIYEFEISNLVPREPVNGNFFIKGTSISGSGPGFGIPGSKEKYPEVLFVLEVIKKTEQILQENTNAINENTSLQENSNEQIAVSENETTAETTTAITTTENNSVNQTASTSESAETNLIESTDTNVIATAETGSQDSAVTEGTTSPITGFFTRVFNFFIGLTPTGFIVSETGTGEALTSTKTSEINGQVSFGNDFVYNLQENEDVRIKPGSVFSSSGFNIPDESVQLARNQNQVTVSTSYFEIEEGFGSEFLGDEKESITIDLSSLGLVLNEGELKAKIVYGGEEIISTNLTLKEGISESTSEIPKNILNETKINITIEKNATNITIGNETNINQTTPFIQVVNVETANFVLTEEEKALLLEEFGETVVKKTRSEVINGLLVVRYEFKDNWIEFSYDASLPEDKLNYEMSLDRMKWLKDIAQRVKNEKIKSQESSFSESIENFTI